MQIGMIGLGRMGGSLRHPEHYRYDRALPDVAEVWRLKAALEAGDVVGGGGNAKKLRTRPKRVRLGSSANAFAGRYRMWKDHG